MDIAVIIAHLKLLQTCVEITHIRMHNSFTMAVMEGPWGISKRSSPRVDAVREGDSEVQPGFVEVSIGVEVESAAGGGAAPGAGGDATPGWCCGWEPAGMAL